MEVFAELFCLVFRDFLAQILPTFCGLFGHDFYAAFVDLSEFSVSSEASQNGCLCHSY